MTPATSRIVATILMITSPLSFMNSRTQRARDHHRQQKLPARILERAGSRDEDLERQWRRQYRGNGDGEKTEPFVGLFDAFDTLQIKAFPQHGLRAAPG